MSQQDGAGQRAPLPAYLGAGVTALVGAVIVGGVAALARGDEPWPTFLIFAGCTLGPFLALAWFVFVSQYTVEPEPHAEDSAERHWYEQAAASAFHDVILLGGITLMVMSVFGGQFGGATVLLWLLILAGTDVLVRYQVLKRRAVR